MANSIIHKRSATPSKAPATTDLVLGELGINTFDGKVYFKKDAGTPAIRALANEDQLTAILGTTTTVSSNTTAVTFNTYVFTASLTLTLPLAPAAGDWVDFSDRSGLTTSVIARNSQNIMGVAEDMTLNVSNSSGRLVFVDAPRGWVFV